MFIFKSPFLTGGIEVVERRKNKRFRVDDGALAVLGSPSAKVGQIIDVGMGGLAFRYIADEALPKESSQLDILLAEDPSHLYGLRCEIVYDVETINVIPFTSLAERRRGVKFSELTHNQKVQLAHFIRNHTDPDMGD